MIQNIQKLDLTFNNSSEIFVRPPNSEVIIMDFSSMKIKLDHSVGSPEARGQYFAERNADKNVIFSFRILN